MTRNFKFAAMESVPRTIDRRLLLVPDVWRLIFQYLSVSPQDIVNLTLTCSSFRWLAQPLLFRKMSVQPFQTFISDEERTDVAFTNDGVEHELERLQFYASSTIAPSIKSCQISPLKIWNSPIPTTPDMGNNIILDTFLQMLPVFGNLEELSLGEFDLTAEQADQLTRINRFQSIIVCGCRLPVRDPPHPSLRVDRLSITATHATVGLIKEWLLATQLDGLKSFYLSEPGETFHFLTSPWPSSMQSLRSLEIPVTTAPVQHLVATVSKLSALEHLTLCRTTGSQSPYNLDQDIPQTTHPSLHSFHGPLDIFMHFRFPQLRHLTISGLSASSSASAEPNALFHTLSHLQEVIQQLEYLRFKVHFLTEALATMLFSLLPSESSLRCFFLIIHHLNGGLISDSMKVFCNALLRCNLPSHIRKLRVVSINRFNLTPSPIDTKPLVDVLVQKNRSLQCVWLQQSTFTFFWKRSSDGSGYVSTISRVEHLQMFADA